MARKSDIRLRRSATQGAVPTVSQLNLGELALNTYDGKLYMKKNVGGTESIVEVGGGAGLTSSFILHEYTATSNQTTFSGADSNSNTLAYDNTGTPGKLMVYLNGVLLDNGTDYTATNGTSVVLTNGASAGDVLQVGAYKSVVSVQSFSLDDNQKLFLGTGSDLEIFHNGSHSIINDAGTGNLKFQVGGTEIFEVSSSGIALSSGKSITGLDTDDITEASNLYYTNERVDDRVAALLTAGSGVTLSYDDANGALTISSTGSYSNSDVESYLDANGTTFPDNIQSQYGTGNDLRIVHNGTDSLVTNHNGDLKIINYADDKDIVFQTDNGSGGTETYFYLDGSARKTIYGRHLKLLDNTQIQIGTNPDMLLYHDATDSYITNSTGDLIIDAANDITIDVDGGDIRLKDGGTQFGRLSNFLGSLVITSSSTDTAMIIGNTDGSMIMGGNVNMGDNKRLRLGDGPDLQLYHDGTHSYMDSSTGSLYIRTGNTLQFKNQSGSETLATFAVNGASTLYYDNSAKLATTSGGVSVTGNFNTSGGVTVGDSSADVLRFVGILKQGSGSGTTVLDASRNLTVEDATVGGDLTVTGDLTVNGTTTTLNAANLDVEDKNITLNYGSGDTSGSADGAGITIQDAVNSSTNATILWDATNNEFDFSHPIKVAGSLGVTNIVTNKIVKFNGSILDDSNITDTGSLITLGSETTVSGHINMSSGNDIKSPDNFAIYDTGGSIDRFAFSTNSFYNVREGGYHRFTTHASGGSAVETVRLQNNRVQINNSSSIDNNAQLHITGYSSGHAGITMQDVDVTNGKTFIKQSSGATEIQTQNGSSHGIFKITGWNGSAAAEFLRVNSAGNVGIGTASPNRKLHVSGSGGTIAAKIEATDGSQTSIDLTNSEGAVRLINDGGSFSIYDDTDSAERLLIDTSGNVEIFDETSSNNHKLTLQKVYNRESAIEWARGSDVDAKIRVDSSEDLIFDYNNTNLDADLIFRSNSSEVGRFLANGNFGIGTSSPARQLTVQNSSNAIMALIGSTSGLAYYTLGDTDDDNYAQILLDNSTNKLQIQNGGGTGIANRGITLDSSENVGIGTSSPARALEVDFTGSTYGARFTRSDSAGNSLIEFANNQGVKNVTGFDSGNSGYIISTGSTVHLLVKNSTGNVGIGTTSPGVSLDVGSKTDALRVPNGTTAQRPTAALGQLRYNTTTSEFEGYAGGAWGKIGGGGDSFGTVAVAGQSNVVAEQENDTLTLVGANGISITTNASSDEITIDGRTSYSPFNTDLFTTANSSTTAFTLTSTPADEDNLIVFVEGVYQNKNSYTLSGTTLTLDDAPASGSEVVVHIIGDVVSGVGLNRDNFTGDGSTTDFTLSIDPLHENNTFVYSDGVYQEKSEYSISGTTITFTSAPASGDSIEVIMPQATEVQTPSTNAINAVGQFNESNIVPQVVTTTTVASTSATTIATHSASTYRTIKYIVQCTQGTDYHSTEINLIHDGTTVYITEYGTLYDNAALGTFNATISGGNILLQITAGSATSMEVKVVSSAITL